MSESRPATAIGITDAMIESYGEVIFALSNNLQTRRGDPVRHKDFAAIEAHRHELGMSDGEIAARIGLTTAQVSYIRNVMEWRRYERRSYEKLKQLGGGRRYRPEHQRRPQEERSMHEAAHDLRAALTFDGALSKRYIAAGWWSNDTLDAWLTRHARERPHAPAVIHGDRVITFSDAYEQVARCAGGLYRLGLRKGDVVAVQLPNLLEYVIAYLAIARLGAVMTTIYMPYRKQELATLLGHSRARAFICLVDAGGFGAAAAAVALRHELPNLASIITVDGTITGTSAFNDLLQADATDMQGEAPVGADPLVLLYTSGTTASPKGVVHNNHTFLSNVRLSAPEHQITPQDVLMSAAPFGHLFGLYSLNLSICAGAANLLLPMFTPPALARTIEQGRATVTFTAPAHVAACLGAGLFDRHDISSVRLAIMSGAAVPAALASAFAAKVGEAAVCQLWGMTEIQAGAYTRPGDGLAIAARSAGRPSPATQLRVLRDDGSAADSGEEGHLQVRGPLLFPGYLDNPQANAEAFTEDGYFRTGDLATIDADGNVAIVGRSKDIINRGGVKYNPRDIEDLLDGHPKIAQAAIVPYADAVLGERACAVITLAGAETITLEEICDYLLSFHIAKTKLPERLQVVAAMPLTPTRKIIKGRLRVEP